MDMLRYFYWILSSKLVASLAIVAFVLYQLSRKFTRDPRLVQFAESLPGPPSYPVIGNTLGVLLQLRKAGYTPFFTNSMLTYGPIVRFWFGTGLGVLLSDPEEVEMALSNSNCLSRSPGNDTYRILFGNSLLVASPVSVWKRKRKEYQPFFTKNSLLEHIPASNETIYEFFEKQKFAVEGKESDWGKNLDELAFDLFTKTFLNYEVPAAQKSDINMSKNLHSAFLQLSTRWLLPSKITNFLSTWIWRVDIPVLRNKLTALIDTIVKTNETLISGHGENLSTTKNSIDSAESSSSFVDTLIRVKKEIGEDDCIHGELTYFFMAAGQTTNITLASCLLALAVHQEYQEELYRQIHQVFGDDERHADISDLEKLPYLTQVLKESLRLFSVTPAMYRLIENDTKIGTRTFPKGCFIMINITGIHHDPKLYPDPFRFNPDNFTDEAISKRPRCSYIPFGAGPRNCLAKAFVEQNVKLNLIALLRKFSFHTAVNLDDLKFKLSVFESLSSGYPMTVKPRKRTT